jgi:hypothetical protein
MLQNLAFYGLVCLKENGVKNQIFISLSSSQQEEKMKCTVASWNTFTLGNPHPSVVLPGDLEKN